MNTCNAFQKRVLLGMQEEQEFSTEKEYLRDHRTPKHCVRSGSAGSSLLALLMIRD